MKFETTNPLQIPHTERLKKPSSSTCKKKNTMQLVKGL